MICADKSFFREFEGDTAARLTAVGVFSLFAPFIRAHTLLQGRKFTLFPKGKALPNWVKKQKARFLLFLVII